LPAQNKEGVKGRYWFMDADVREGALTGKTGKTILTILRHLGRLHEVLLWGVAWDLPFCVFRILAAIMARITLPSTAYGLDAI